MTIKVGKSDRQRGGQGRQADTDETPTLDVAARMALERNEPVVDDLKVVRPRTRGRHAGHSVESESRGKSLAKSAAKAYDYIRVRILDGRLAAASHLREHILAAEIGVSRTPIREALRRLAADGFVKFVPNQGASVIEWSDQALADLIDVRSELAAMAARLASRHITPEKLEELRVLNAQVAEVAEHRLPGFLGEAARLNIAFHRIVFNAANNPWLAQMLDQTAYLPVVQRAHFAFDVTAWQHGIARYADLIDALAAGEGEWAAACIKAHFLAAKHSISKARSQHGAKAAVDVDAGAGDITRQRRR